MELRNSHQDKFERLYVGKFAAMAGEYGISIKYDYDRAALDQGLHLTVPSETGEIITDIRIWFQFKGVMAMTLPLAKFESTETISLLLQISHLRQWYRSPEPVYLVVYVESADKFLAVDTKTFIDDHWGDQILHPGFKERQKEITLHISKGAVVDNAFWDSLHRHRSTRIDGQSYRGISLPHRRSVYSEVLRKQDPTLYTDVLASLLAAHRYQVQNTLDTTVLFPKSHVGIDTVTLTTGIMYDAYEWIPYITSELVEDENGYRNDGKVMSVQGPCAVLIHSAVINRPNIEALKQLGKDLTSQSINNMLVFINHYLMIQLDEKAYAGTGEYMSSLGPTGVFCIPQHLEDISRTILLAGNIYMRFRNQLTWISDYTQDKIERGEWTIADYIAGED